MSFLNLAKDIVDGGAILLVWDAEGSPPIGDWTTVLWRGFADGIAPDIISIPKLVEADADNLKSRFLAWTYELGETRIQGRPIVDHLELRPGFSYWWMTLIAEKCNFSKSPQITDAIRLMAIEDWAKKRSVSHVVLASPNIRLSECMGSWCAKSGVLYEWQRLAVQGEHVSLLRKLYQTIPHSFQALISFLCKLSYRWPLKGVGLKEWCQTEGQVTFISYLDNLVPDAVTEGRFESRYWGHLPNVLQRDNCRTNWLHLYARDAILPTPGKAANVIRQFNKKGNDEQVHVTLDAFLDFKVVVRTLRDWFCLAWAARHLFRIGSTSSAQGLDLWPLFQEDWYRSLYGQTALSNLLFLNLFESALNSLPTQRLGVYLKENQGWEAALIHAWKSMQHDRLVGTPHSTVRYWDLRYFFDPRGYERISGNHLPLPDHVALNGSAALDNYLMGGYPEGDIVEVEALRYLHLADTEAKTDDVMPASQSSLRVLVLSDYVLSNTQQQMRLLERGARFLPMAMVITVKPHPNCPIRPNDYPGLSLVVATDPVAKLLHVCDVVYASAVTSAAVDAYCAGLPVVSLLDLNALNLSPLRGRMGVSFVSTPEELANALITAASVSRTKPGPQDYFTIDSKLPRWRKLVLASSK